MIALIDTNVLLDVLQVRQPFAVAGERVWKLVETGQVDGHISAISFNNIFYLARKESGGLAAFDSLRVVRRIFRIVPLDEQIIDEAIASAPSDFEDAIQASAARRIKADHVVTRNVKDFRSLNVKCLTPVEFLALYFP